MVMFVSSSPAYDLGRKTVPMPQIVYYFSILFPRVPAIVVFSRRQMFIYTPIVPTLLIVELIH